MTVDISCNQAIIYREGGPVVQWWPEVELRGQVLYNMAFVDDEWFMLEFPDEDYPLNPAVLRLCSRRICVREAWYAQGETLPDYIRRKAAEWLEFAPLAQTA